MNVYQVKDWDVHYENAKSRERESCSFVCVPNKQHGLSFSRIMNEPDGSSIYGIWCLILGACSQQRKPRNGWLTHDGYQTGTAWVPQDLALKFRRSEKEIERAILFLSKPGIEWILCHVFGSNEAEYPSDTRSVPAQYPSGIVKEEKEENRKEEKYCIDFELFWKLYPRKIAKGNAYREWKKIKPDSDLIIKIMESLKNQKRTWNDPKFVKHPERWLKGNCWEDEVSVARTNLRPSYQPPQDANQ